MIKKIVLIEDNLDHAELIMDSVKESLGRMPEFSCYTHLGEAIKDLDKTVPDLVLTDLNLPDSDRAQTIKCLSKMNLQIPVIALTCLDEIDAAKELLRHGIQDYLLKSELSPSIINRSITYSFERKNYELLLRKKEQDQKMFCQILSHDFNAPIRRVLMTSKFYLEENLTSLSDDQKNSLQVIISETNRLQFLVADLSSFLKVDAAVATFDYVNATQLIEEIVNSPTLFPPGKTAKIEVSGLEKLPTIRGNHSMLTLVFQNIMVNAIKHNTKAPHLKVYSVASDDKSFITIAIADNGPGISSDFHEKIFMPFFRLCSYDQVQGSGLGLSIVKTIIEKHNGKIWIESTMGVGTTFFIKLPL